MGINYCYNESSTEGRLSVEAGTSSYTQITQPEKREMPVRTRPLCPSLSELVSNEY